MELPSNHVEKTKGYWEGLAKEPVKVEYHAGVYHGHCSETAAQRLMHVYRYNTGRASVVHLKESNCWSFQLITNLEKAFKPA